jgi:putative colanic acid biosynthesis acetyltransferase WcaF
MITKIVPVNLVKDFDTGTFKVGASYFKIYCWYLINLIIFRSGLIPFSSILVFILRVFGSTIGKDVRIKPHIQIKYPWKLTIGDHSWLGDCVIENLNQVIIGRNVCISQGASLITGNHNYSERNFSLITKPIILEDGVWICANSIVCPGVVAKSHSILCIGSVANKDLEPFSIYKGNPARFMKDRIINP